MKVIEHPSYTRRMAGFYRTAAGVSLCGVSIGCILLSLKMVIGIASFLVLAGIILMREILRDGGQWWIAGCEGERRVQDTLKSLSDAYIAVTNFVVPNTRQGDVDLLLIGPMGIVVVEIKTYTGTILYKNRRWWRIQKNGCETPLKHVSSQARGNERAVRSFIEQQSAQNPLLRQAAETVTAVLVFDRTERLYTDSLDIPALHTHELADYVCSLPERLTIDQIEALRKLLQGTSGRKYVCNTALPPMKPSSLQMKPKTQTLPPAGDRAVCCLCGKEVSEKVEQYCQERPERFGGKVYCYAHQQSIRKSA